MNVKAVRQADNAVVFYRENGTALVSNCNLNADVGCKLLVKLNQLGWLGYDLVTVDIDDELFEIFCEQHDIRPAVKLADDRWIPARSWEA